jgi:cellobiose-specific phosphotransferase system component IIC
MALAIRARSGPNPGKHEAHSARAGGDGLVVTLVLMTVTVDKSHRLRACGRMPSHPGRAR